MKLKEIKTGMVIHCQTNEEVSQLGLTNVLGKKAENYVAVPCYVGLDIYGDVIWNYERNRTKNMGNVTVVEFADLIIPDELSAVELLKIFTDICTSCRCGGNCPFDYIKHKSEVRTCPEFVGEFPEEVVEICRQWKADHEKKEQEVEWQPIIRIIQICENNVKKCVHEIPLSADKEDLEEYAGRCLLNYVKEHDGNYFSTIERVCRVKE